MIFSLVFNTVVTICVKHTVLRDNAAFSYSKWSSAILMLYCAKVLIHPSLLSIFFPVARLYYNLLMWS